MTPFGLVLLVALGGSACGPTDAATTDASLRHDAGGIARDADSRNAALDAAAVAPDTGAPMTPDARWQTPDAEALRRDAQSPETPADAANDGVLPEPDRPPPPPPPPRERCAGEVDEDADGLIDCDDPDCLVARECAPVPEVCDNTRDDDRDGRVDCCDPDCAATCPPLNVVAYTEAEVQRLFDDTCAECHMNGRRDGTLPLDAPFLEHTVGRLTEQVRDMPYITPGDRERSYLYHKVNESHLRIGGAGQRMPMDAGLCTDQIERIGLFIDGR